MDQIELVKKLKKFKKKRGFFHLFLWLIGYYKDKHLPQVPAGFVYPNPQESFLASSTVTWINHSTFLIKNDEVSFLTDPIWSNRCSPFKNFGPKRQIEPPIAINALPSIDFVLISHDHYDHLDLYTIGRLNAFFPNIKWIIPMGVKKWFNKKMPSINEKNIVELFWEETKEFYFKNQMIKVTSVPAKHFSGRGLFNQNHTLWMGMVVSIETNQNKKRFYFAGDTGYDSSYFKQIGKDFSPIDLSLIPVGVYSPRDFMRPIHINPEEAIQIHQEVGSKLSIGCHFGTFILADENLKQPPYDLYQALQKKKVSVDTFRILKPGQTINW